MSMPLRPETFRESQGERTIDEPYEPLSQGEEIGDFGREEFRAQPVYQVEPPPTIHTLRRWNALTVTLQANDPSQVAAQSWVNRRVFIRNVSNNRIYLVPEATSPTFMGYALESGRQVELTHNRAVWAIATSDDSELTVLNEYDQPEDENMYG